MDLGFELDNDMMMEMMEAFQFFDTNSDGVLSKYELKGFLQGIGQNPTDEDVKCILESVDDNDDQFLSFDEYARLLKNHVKDKQTVRIELEQAFRYFDTDRTETLDRVQLRKALTQCGREPLTNKEADEFFALMDKDGDNAIDLTEFVDFMCSMSEFEGHKQQTCNTQKQQ